MNKIILTLMFAMLLVGTASALNVKTKPLIEGVMILDAVGNSMFPYLQTDDLLNLTKPTDLKVGDIIVFDYNAFPIIYKNYAHRITFIGRDRKGWFAITKGDNNYFRDFGKRRTDDIKFKVEKI